MKRVLILGPDFAPSSMPPALRVRFFAQHLPEFGWEPTVLAVDPQFYEWSIDPDNEKLVPEWLRVVRTGAWPAGVTRKFGLGDLGFRSLWQMGKEMRRLHREQPFDLVFVPVPPNPTMLLGRWAHAVLGIPYVVDFIDPVVTDYYWTLPPSQRPPKWALAYAMARVIEEAGLRNASRLVGVDRSYFSEALRRYPWLKSIEIAGIPYGGEPDDFVYVRKHPRPNRFFDPSDGLFHMGYVGRGGPDMFPALRALFAAIRAGNKEEPDLFGRLRIHFVGTTYAHNAEKAFQVLPLAREEGVEEWVSEYPPRVSYLDAIQILLDSDALLALGSESAHYTASKIFPYILAKKHVLAMFHRASSVIDIVRGTGAGEVISFSAEQPLSAQGPAIGAALARTLRLPKGYAPDTQWSAFEKFTTRAMTRDLALVFDAATASREKTTQAASTVAH